MKDWMWIFDAKEVADLISEKIVDDIRNWVLTEYENVLDILIDSEEVQWVKKFYSEMIEKELKQVIMDNNPSIVKGVNNNAKQSKNI